MEAAAPKAGESKPEAAAPKAGEGKPEAAAPKGGESKPEAAASKAGESKPEASVSKPYISEYDEFFINKKAVSDSVKNVELYNSLTAKEKALIKEMESPYSELAELAADKKVSEDLIKQYKQRLKNYAESVAGNSPAEYKRHIQAIDDLIEAILNLGPVDPDNLSNKAILCALYTVKFSFMLSADDVTAEEYSKIEKMVTVLDEEMKNKQAEAGNTEKKAEK